MQPTIDELRARREALLRSRLEQIINISPFKDGEFRKAIKDPGIDLDDLGKLLHMSWDSDRRWIRDRAGWIEIEMNRREEEAEEVA